MSKRHRKHAAHHQQTELIKQQSDRIALPRLYTYKQVDAVWNRAIDFGEAVQQIDEARHQLGELLALTAEFVIALEGLPPEQQAARMRLRFGATEQAWQRDQLLLIRLDNLRRALQDYGPTIDTVSPGSLRRETLEQVIEVVSRVCDGIHILMREKEPDNGTALLNVLREYGPDYVSTLLDEMSNVTVPKTGRHEGPTPVTAYILREAKRLKSLHGMTDGFTYERLMKELRQRADVQQWLKNSAGLIGPDRDQKLRLQGVEVQAFETAGGRSTKDGGDYLQKLRSNQKGWYDSITT